MWDYLKLSLNRLGQEQNGHRPADDIFKLFFSEVKIFEFRIKFYLICYQGSYKLSLINIMA